MFIALDVWYEGDSEMVETFLALSHSKNKLRNTIVETAKNRDFGIGNPIIYDETLGETCPDDGMYGDQRKRFIIRKVKVI